LRSGARRACSKRTTRPGWGLSVSPTETLMPSIGTPTTSTGAYGSLSFASTYEGIFNDPETNYSVCYIDATPNSTEGNKRGVWYYYDRILELDGFRVYAY
jgi:hypothetical protein